MRISKQSHSAEKVERGDHLGDHVIYSPPQTAAGGNKTEGSNTIVDIVWVEILIKKIIDVDIILSITLNVTEKLLIRFYSGNLRWNRGLFYTILACSKREFLLF